MRDPKAAPMSRKVTQVTSHSPSHSSVGLRLVVGLAVQARSRASAASPQSVRVDARRRRRACRRSAPRRRRPVRPSPSRRRGRCGGRSGSEPLPRVDAARRRRVRPSPRSPGSALAGTGVDSVRSVQARSRLRQLHGDLDRMAAVAAVRIADRHAAEIAPAIVS